MGIYRYNADYNPLKIIVSIERDREVDPHYSTDRDQEGDPECSRDQNCEGEPRFCTCQDREVNLHSPDGSGQHSEDQDRESYQKYFMDQDLEADPDRGSALLCGDHPTSGDRLCMKIPSAIDITKKIKSVEWIQDRTKQEIDATREIANGGTESEVADLL